jgi:Uma2 family endonuclease
MATLIVAPEHKVILHGVSWETYERLRREHQDVSGTHFIYDEGELEIMVMSLHHEESHRDLALLVQLVALELRVRFRQAGSTTFQRKWLQKGFEPDSAFYFTKLDEIDNRATAEAIPAPDLIIEVEVSTPSLNRFPIFAAFGIPEVWRYNQSGVHFYRLEAGKYTEIARSMALPALSAETVTRLLEERSRMDVVDWSDVVRDWARQQR